MESREIANEIYNELLPKYNITAYLISKDWYVSFIENVLNSNKLNQQNKQLLDKFNVLKRDYIALESVSKQLTEHIDIKNNEIDKLKSKVSNWMDKYTEVNEENKKLKSELKDKDIDLQHYKKMASNNNHF